MNINCNTQQLKINEETSCTLSVSNLDFTIIDVTGKVKVGDNLSIVSSSYDSSKWLSLDTTFSVSDGQLKFDKNITKYTINVLHKVDNIEVLYELSDNKSHAELIGNKNLSVGENEFIIKVTAENGNTKEYKITVIRDEKIDITSSNKASNIVVKGYKISFDKNKYEYKIKTSDKKLDIEITLEDSNSTYEIIGNENLTKGSIISIIITDKLGNNNIYKIMIDNDNKININNTVIIVLLIILLIISVTLNIILRMILLRKNKILKQ